MYEITDQEKAMILTILGDMPLKYAATLHNFIYNLKPKVDHQIVTPTPITKDND